jgi:hypothetical protein
VYSAEYGMNSGAQANVSIKSGTNLWHGTAFEFLRNNVLDARGFFLAPNQAKNKLRRNQFGGVVSGPIRKDYTFFLQLRGAAGAAGDAFADDGSNAGDAERGPFRDSDSGQPMAVRGTPIRRRRGPSGCRG